MCETFFEEKYLKTIQFVTDKKLLDESIGYSLVALIQYCMPPPTLEDIRILIDVLLSNKIQADWAVKDELLAIQIRIKNHPDYCDNRESKPGRNYPISFGIQRISDLKEWPLNDKADCITSFVEFIYQNTPLAELMYNDAYYIDVYQIRDVIISQYANSRSLRLHPQTEDQIENKRQAFGEISNSTRVLGGTEASTNTLGYWSNPPEIEFAKSKPVRASNSEDDVEISKATSFENNDYGWLTTKDQDKTAKRKIYDWSRSNVRSLADPNQLQLVTIIKYWQHLMRSDCLSLLIISVLTIATGITKKRWLNLQITENQPTRKNEIVLSPSKNLLSFVITGGPTNFQSNRGSPSQNEIIKLSIPSAVTKYLSSIKSMIGSVLNDSHIFRRFSKTNPGPSPTLNRIGSSGHTLLRRFATDEVSAYALAGNIPIQFQVKNTYVTRNNQEINKAFSNILNSLRNIITIRLTKDDPLTKVMNQFFEHNEKSHYSHLIGSQLGDTKTINFAERCKTSLSNIQVGNSFRTATSIKDTLSYINQFELYYYWMLQFSDANRPVGPLTKSHQFNDLRLHKDKNSKHYEETKLLDIAPLVKSQFAELEICRKVARSTIAVCGFNIEKDKIAYSLARHYEQYSKGHRIKLTVLENKKAVQLAEKLWGLQPKFQRGNFSRHMCASYANSRVPNNTCDAWLGHHIDGWYPYSPNSSISSFNFSTTLNKLRQRWLDELGFKLIKSPLI